MTFGEYCRALQAGPVGGPRAALPVRRVPRGPADDPGRAQDRGAARPHRVARRAGAPGRLVACSTSGRSSLRPDLHDPPRDEPVVPPAPRRLTDERPRVPGAGAQRAVPPRAARGAARTGRARRARRIRRVRRGGLGGGAGRATATSTTRSAPAPTPAARAASSTRLGHARPPVEWRVRQILDDPAGDHDWGISADRRPRRVGRGGRGRRRGGRGHATVRRRNPDPNGAVSADRRIVGAGDADRRAS